VTILWIKHQIGTYHYWLTAIKWIFCIKFVHKSGGINTINECLGAKILLMKCYINEQTFKCSNICLHPNTYISECYSVSNLVVGSLSYLCMEGWSYNLFVFKWTWCSVNKDIKFTYKFAFIVWHCAMK